MEPLNSQNYEIGGRGSSTVVVEDLWFAAAWRFRHLLVAGEYVLLPLERFKQIWEPRKPFAHIMTEGRSLIQENVRMWMSLIVYYSRSLDMVPDYPPLAAVSPFNLFTNQDPAILLRYWCPCSHTDFDKTYGFRCSNWRACVPATSFEDLLKNKSTALDHIRNHCHGADIPSPYISTSDDVAWVYRTTQKKFAPQGLCDQGHQIKVAFISVAKLAHLAILYDRTDNRVKIAGGKLNASTNEGGVDFAWNRHWVVYGWIPPMCITKIVTAREFWTTAEAFGVLDSKSTLYYEARHVMETN